MNCESTLETSSAEFTCRKESGHTGKHADWVEEMNFRIEWTDAEAKQLADLERK